MKNGLFLQKETVPHIELDLIDGLDNSSQLRRKQVNYL
jgi:hypothetical protein